jgi:hypothetical protein
VFKQPSEKLRQLRYDKGETVLEIWAAVATELHLKVNVVGSGLADHEEQVLSANNE